MLSEVLAAVASRGDRVAVRYRNNRGEWLARNWRQLDDEREIVAAGLMALGLSAGARTALVGRAGYRSLVADLAAWTAGAAPAGLYPARGSESLVERVFETGASVAFVEDRADLDVLLGAMEQLPGLERIVTTRDLSSSASAVLTWTELEALGRDRRRGLSRELDGRRRAVEPDDLAYFTESAGATEAPRLLRFTHRALAAQLDALEGLVGVEDCLLLTLPSASFLARTFHGLWARSGCELAVASDASRLTADMAALRPTLVPTTPRVLERLYTRVAASGLDAKGMKGRLFRRALELNDRYSRASHGKVPAGLGVRMSLSRALVFRDLGERLTELLGGALSAFVVSGAPMPEAVAHFFHHAGVGVREGWGLAETGLCTLAEPGEPGTAGRALPGVSLEIEEGGELRVQGPGLSLDARVVSGWLRTGDRGRLDEEGRVVVSGRLAERLDTPQGEVMPALVEGALKSISPLISHAYVDGVEDRLVALLTLDKDTLHKVAAELGLTESARLVDQPEIRDTVEAVVASANAHLSAEAQLHGFAIVPGELDPSEVAPSGALRRAVIRRRRAAVIAAAAESG